MESSFTFRELDPEGFETLEAISKAGHFNRWMYAKVSPHLEGNILEIGSGIGNLSSFFLADGKKITLSDVRANYCDQLRFRFGKEKSLQSIQLLDLVDPDFTSRHAALLGTFDSAFALNVIEHIENDKLALQNLKSLLKPGGKLLILVPAGQWLYNGIDKKLMHFRRYSKHSLKSLFIETGFSVRRTCFFNALGVPAWWWSGSIMKNDMIKGGQMNTFDHLIPIARVIDFFVSRIFGLSVITIGIK